MPATSLDCTGRSPRLPERCGRKVRRISWLSIALVGIATLPGCKVLVDVLLLPSESAAGSRTAIGGSIAETHGITHWEGESATPFAIGQGLAEAGITAEQMGRICRSTPGPVSTPAYRACSGASQSSPS